MALRAYFYDYDRARQHAHAILDKKLRSESELSRVLTRILCMGRTHMDQCVPDNFWPNLQSDTINPSLLDAASILSELFARLRLMSETDILDRYRFAAGCLRRAGPWDSSLTVARGRARYSVPAILAALSRRARMHLERLDLGASTELDCSRLEQSVCERPLAAYVLSTLLYSETIASQTLRPAFVTRPAALDLSRATGSPADSRIQLSGVFKVLHGRGLMLLLSGLADEQLLLHPSDAPRAVSVRLQSNFQLTSGSARWMQGAANLLFTRRTADGGQPTRRAFAAISMCSELLARGELAAARHAIDIAATWGAARPEHVAHRMVCELLVARRTLRWDSLSEPKREAGLSQERLPAALNGFWSSYLKGCREFVGQEWEAGRRALRCRKELSRCAFQ